MANLNTTPRRLNLDNDIRTLQKEDARDMLNVRAYSSSGEDAFSIENIKSTIEANYNKASGSNVVVGSISHSEKNDIYIFVWNEGENHRVLRYNSILDKITVILESSLLGFTKKCLVQGFAITNQSPSETLLYWTDGVTQPKKINVFRALQHIKGDFVNGYPQTLELEHIRWIKYPPVDAPSFVHGKDSDIAYNNLSDNVFQFRYRYVHKDGERTAYSASSKASFSEYQLRNGVFQNQNLDLIYNYVDINLKNAWNDVDKIEVIAKNINSTEWVLVKTLDNDPLSESQTYRFYNDDVYNAVDQFDAIKNYDAVPIKAIAAENIFNRAVFGNAVDGYDNLPQDVLDDQTTYNARYSQRNVMDSDDITFSVNNAPDELQVTFNTSAISVSVGDTFYISFSARLREDTPFLVNNPKDVTGNFYVEYTANDTDTIADVVDKLAIQLSNLVDNEVKIYTATNNSNNLFLTIDFLGTEVIDLGSVSTNQSKKITNYEAEASHKSGAKHPYAVAYYDESGRSGSAQKNKDNSPYVKFLSNRGSNIKRGVANIDVRLGYPPPVWAKSYRFLYGGNKSVGSFLQYSIASAFINKNNVSGDSDNNIYIPLHNFKGGFDDNSHSDAYRNSTKAIPDYQFNEGDRLRIISYVPAGSINGEDDRIYASEYLDFKVLGFEYFQADSTTNPYYDNSTTYLQKNTFGWTLILEDPNRGDEWSYSYIKSNGSDSTNWSVSGGNGSSGALVEIYSPKDRNIEDVYYETSNYYEIGNAGLPTRYHKCERDQYSEYSITISESTAVSFSNASVRYNTSDFKLYIGDVVNFSGGTNSPSGDFTVVDIVQNNSISNVYDVTFDNVLGSATSGAELGNTILKLNFAALTIKGGDVWLRPRNIITGTLSALNPSPKRNFFNDVVEDYYANDFFESNAWSCKGRVQAFSEYAKQETRKAGIWLSEAYFPSTNINGLSSFNLSNEDTPLKEYDRSLGSIQRLWARGDELIMMQENKISFVRVGKDVLTTGDGGNIITLTSSVLSEQNPYKGDYGICMNPESFASKDGNCYFLDIKRGKVLRLGADGLTPISNNGISSLLDSLSKEYNEIVNSIGFKAYGGFDRENDEYNLTFGQILNSEVSIGDPNVDPIGTLPQSRGVRRVSFNVTDSGIVGGQVQNVDVDMLSLASDLAVGDIVKVSFEDRITVLGEDEQITNWISEYTVLDGDDLDNVINAIGNDLVDRIEQNTLIGAFSNNGLGVLTLNIESLLSGDLVSSSVSDNTSVQERYTDVNPTDIVVELPVVSTRTPIETIDYDGVPTEAESFDLETLSIDGFIPINPETIDALTTTPVGISSSGYDFYGDVDLNTQQLSIPISNNSLTFDVETTKIVDPLTIVFHERSKTWAGFRSYTPEGYANVNYIMLSFKDGAIWKHERGDNYNIFYNDLYPSVVSAVLVPDGSTNTIFNSISTESNVPFEAEELYTNLTKTSFAKERFSKKEGIWYADIPRATSTTKGSNTNVYGVGGIDNQSGDNITFSNKINEIGIVVGDELFNSSGTVPLGFVTSIVNEFTVSVSVNTLGVQGDFVYGVKNSKVEGDAARGVYLVAKLKYSSNERIELFSVNSHIDLSLLTTNQT